MGRVREALWLASWRFNAPEIRRIMREGARRSALAARVSVAPQSIALLELPAGLVLVARAALDGRAGLVEADARRAIQVPAGDAVEAQPRLVDAAGAGQRVGQDQLELERAVSRAREAVGQRDGAVEIA